MRASISDAAHWVPEIAAAAHRLRVLCDEDRQTRGAPVAAAQVMAIEHILVPTDFSDAAEAARTLAARIAQRTGAKLTLLHVDPPPPALGLAATEPAYTPPQLFEQLQRDHDLVLRRELEAAQRRCTSKLDVVAVLRRMPVVDGILAHAQELEADLIVMGFCGYGAGRFRFGSVASKVVRAAHCPVVVTRSELPKDIRTALVAVDYSRFSRPTAQFAAQLLEPDGTLELVHAWHDPYLAALERTLGGREELSGFARDAGAQRDRVLNRFAEQDDLPVTASCCVVTGNAPSAILDRAAQIDADLIAVGAHGRDTLSQRALGTVADRVVRQATVPVLVFPEDALE